MLDTPETPIPLPIARPAPILLEPDELPVAMPRRKVARRVEVPEAELLVDAELPPSEPFRPKHYFLALHAFFVWIFGFSCMILGLAFLAAIPILQFLSLGYLLECSGRMARTGSFREGFIGIRLAARLGGIVLASWLFLLPVRFVADLASSASIIDPGGSIARGWRIGLMTLIAFTAFHILMAVANGGKLRHFAFPFNFVFVLLKVLRGGFYTQARDAVWETLISLRLPYYFLLGVRGFFVAGAWLVLPISLIAAGRLPGQLTPIIGFYGAFLLTLVLVYLPFLQLNMARTGRVRDGFDITAVRQQYRRAPVMFALAFVVTLLFALPLYLLKIEVVPQDAAWLPSLFFVGFIYPARILSGWAMARASRRETPRHWAFRWLARLPFLPVAAFYVLVVFFTQYTSWHGVWSLYEQHAFLLPVPFLGS